jgi:Ser/Thr protein kinase RdoA (MazF antagonist)
VAREPDKSQPIHTPHLGPVYEDEDGRARRDRFDAKELAIILSHYDLGPITSISEYRRGSRRSPKVRIESARGEFLLKRRAPGRDDPYRAAFAQDLQLHLADEGYPVPALIGTHDDNNSMLQYEDRLYELFAFVRGTRDDRSPLHAQLAGHALGRLHRLLRDHRSSYAGTEASYHGSHAVIQALRQIPTAVTAVETRTSRAALEASCEYLRKAYLDSNQRVNALGFRRWPRCVVHGDWHPGNLLFRGGAVVGVLDFDSARIEPRMTDVANAALQFSMPPGEGLDPAEWPEALDKGRIRAVLAGYDQGSDDPMTDDERRALFWLIVEALVQESVIPIAATGRFAHLAGSSFLQMVERKVRWLRPRAARFVAQLEDPS